MANPMEKMMQQMQGAPMQGDALAGVPPAAPAGIEPPPPLPEGPPVGAEQPNPGEGSLPTPMEAGSEMQNQDDDELAPAFQEALSAINADPSNLADPLAKFALAIQQHTIRGLTPHIQELVQGELASALGSRDFFDAHPDLKPHAEIADLVGKALAAEQPDLVGEAAMAEVAKRTREKLNLHQAGPSLPGGTGSGTDLGSGRKTEDKLTTDVKRMRSALRR